MRKIGDVQLEGSNASAEELEEGTEEASESGVDLVLNHRWAEYTFTFWHGHWPGWLRLGLPRRTTTWPTWRITWRRLWNTWRKTTGRVRWTPSRRTSTVWWKGFSASSTTSSFIRVGYLFSIHLHWWLSSGLNPKLPRWVDEPCGHGRTDWLSRDWRRGAPGNTIVIFLKEFSLNSSQSWIVGSYPMFFPNSGGWDGRLETLTSLSKTNAMGSLWRTKS